MDFCLSTPAEILHTLGVRLREQRLAQSLTQRDLAHMAGLSLGALRKLESNGQCSLETLVRAAQALGRGADRALAEHQLEGLADRRRAHQARTTRVDADDVVLVGPAGHQLLQVALLQRLVERNFDFVGGAAELGGVVAGPGHGAG